MPVRFAPQERSDDMSKCCVTLTLNIALGLSLNIWEGVCAEPVDGVRLSLSVSVVLRLRDLIGVRARVSIGERVFLVG